MVQAYHTLVAGDSGGGKTTLLREMYDTYPGLSIWIDHSRTGVDGIGAADLEDAAVVRSGVEARRADATRLQWRCDDPVEAGAQVLQFVREYHEATGHPSQVIVDEAQDQALPDGDVDNDNPIKWMLHQGRDERIKVVIASQDPQDLAYTPLKQCRFWTWVGGWSVFHEGFLRYFSIPTGELPTNRFQYVTLNKRMDVVDRGSTKEEYA